MLRLTDVTEDNWLETASLSVSDDQKGFVASAVSILARGYVYRGCGGRVFVIENDGVIVGAALVREFTDEFCNILQNLGSVIIGQSDHAVTVRIQLAL